MNPELFVSTFLSGVIFAGIASLFGFGVGLAIDLFKLYGGVR